MQNFIDLEFGDGTYKFALPLPQINELQRKAGVGIGGLFSRVLKGCTRIGDDVVLAPAVAEFYALDLIETIRHALVGGGKGIVNGEEVKVTPQLANRLIDTYVLSSALSDSWSLAASILGAVVVGYSPPEHKKKDGSETAPKPKRGRKAGSTTEGPSPTVQ